MLRSYSLRSCGFSGIKSACALGLPKQKKLFLRHAARAQHKVIWKAPAPNKLQRNEKPCWAPPLPGPPIADPFVAPVSTSLHAAIYILLSVLLLCVHFFLLWTSVAWLRMCMPPQMAKMGFVHCPSENSPDTACCFICLKELEGWEPQDDPRWVCLCRSQITGLCGCRLKMQ